MLITLFLLAAGYAVNVAVMNRNGGKMPVMVRAEDALFIIGEPSLGVTQQFQLDTILEDGKHTPYHDGVPLGVFADRIPVSFSLLPHDLAIAFYPFTPWWLSELIDPYEEIVSLGDIAIWLGNFMFYVFMPFYVFFFMFAFTKKFTRQPHK